MIQRYSIDLEPGSLTQYAVGIKKDDDGRWVEWGDVLGVFYAIRMDASVVDDKLKVALDFVEYIQDVTSEKSS